jgi:hypothetical protein
MGKPSLIYLRQRAAKHDASSNADLLRLQPMLQKSLAVTRIRFSRIYYLGGALR